ncbi:MAG: protein kinase family protein [Bacteroidia bacterium]
MEIIRDYIKLSDDPYENYINLDGEEFLLSYLNPVTRTTKGASSNLFILSDSAGETEDRVIKICKSPYYKYSKDKRLARFNREIRAFKLVEKKGLTGIIEFFGSGLVKIGDNFYPYIVLEKAEGDLASFMEENRFAFTLNQKLTFCTNILNNIKKLHEIGIYHRDIKHDNILCVNDEFKIGDLGLVTFQDRDFSMDQVNEKIGPVGWLSPEATNKMLTFEKEIGQTYDCDINHQSDIFQLGKLFWYIFQGNLPTGQVQNADHRFNDLEIYNVIFSMIQYEKARRPNIDAITNQFKPIRERLLA